MINHLRLQKYKGIQEVFLNDLSNVNVLCGKNSSGKSSILECLTLINKYGIGVKVDINKLSPLAEFITSKFSSPSQRQTLPVILEFAKTYISEHPYWYQNQEKELVEDFVHFHKYHHFLGQWNAYDYNYLVTEYIRNNIYDFHAVLIPPKRTLQSNTSINSDQPLSPNGEGAVNRLFFLKNQHVKSNEFIIYQKILATFNDITGYAFNIITNKENKLKLLFRIGNDWLDADDCGLGLRDLLVIITLVLTTDYTFYLIEEPENHLHADFQKRLLYFLKGLKNKQFLLSTHSNVFLDINNVDKIYYCFFDGEVKVSDKTSHSKIINALGYSVTENLTSDALILTEGPSDIPVIQKILKWIGALDKYNIKLWPLGGDIMGEIDLSIFGRNEVFAIIDSDPGSSSARNKFKKKCDNNNIKYYQLNRYAIENYFTLDALKKIFGEKITINNIEENKSVDEQVGFKVKNKTIKGKNIDIIEAMSLTDIEGTDLLSNLNEIKNQIDSSFIKNATEE